MAGLASSDQDDFASVRLSPFPPLLVGREVVPRQSIEKLVELEHRPDCTEGEYGLEERVRTSEGGGRKDGGFGRFEEGEPANARARDALDGIAHEHDPVRGWIEERLVQKPDQDVDCQTFGPVEWRERDDRHRGR